MCEGSDELGRPANEYGNKPDWLVDLGFGGPVPMIRNLSFFTSYRINHETFGLPTNREYYEEDNAQLKLTYRITPSMKLSITGFYGEINSVARVVDAYGDNLYVKGGDGMFQSSLASAQSAYSHRAGSNIYWPSSLTPFDVYKNMQGIAFDHALTPSTFYSLRLTRTYSKNKAIGPDRMRDTTTIRYFGATRVDEAPLGFWWVGGYQEMEDGMLYAAIGAGCRDQSEQDNINFYGDLTSQINKYNQIKLGVIINYDQLYTSYGDYTDYSPTDNTYIEWKHYPIRTGAYIQDKIEFRGIIANIGVRLDYSNPNCEWYTADRYSIYFSKPYKEIFTEICPTEPAKSQLKVSPRFGISHPISEVSKLYFNYGWFYSMAPSSDLYMLGYRKESLGMEFIGNPSADLPRTVAYELGYEHNIAGMFLLHIAGYYKDVSEQTGRVWYTNYDLSVDYWTIENNNYADIRGFEVTLEKPLGSWITGWINYDYKVTTSGFIGRGHYYEDARLQRIYGLQNPYQERPVARPVARADIRLSSPEDWGPTIAGIKPFGGFSLSFIYSWQKGEYFTWDPLETQELRDNVSWVNYSNWDARLSKDVTIGENHIILFMDVRNLLNTKRLHSQGFSDSQDYRNYLESLHLAMYEEEGYEEYTAGNDKPGDIKSENKPYINMPNRDFLTYLDLREVFFGLSFRF